MAPTPEPEDEITHESFDHVPGLEKKSGTNRMIKRGDSQAIHRDERESDPDGVLKPYFPTPRGPFPGVGKDNGNGKA